MARSKTIVKHCSNCNKPFSTADDSIMLCRECTSKELREEAAAELKRQNEVVETRTCKGCGEDFDITVGVKEFLEKKGLVLPKLCPRCREALKKRKEEMGGMTQVCKTCGKSFEHSALAVVRSANSNAKLPDECPNCRRARRGNSKQEAERKKVIATLTCKDCGKEFFVTAGEKAFLEKHGLENMPAHCPDCRRQRKVRALAENMRRFGSEEVEESIVMDDVTPLDNVECSQDAVVPLEHDGEDGMLDIIPNEVDETAPATTVAVAETVCPSELPYDGDDAALTDVEKASEPESDIEGDAQENEAEPEIAPEMDTQEPANMEMAQPSELTDETESVEKADA